jgi:hypothetical protein
MHHLAPMTALLLAASANAQSPAPAAAAAAAKTAANDYSKAETWLCRPGRKDACAVDQSTTVVAADGKLATEPFTANPAAPIDCFYVYPTVSLDPTPNSDMTAGPEEMSVISAQFARFGSQCRTFAPLYRQITLGSLRAMTSGKPAAADRMLGYNDVLNAWNYYLEHDNQGRGVVLIGHSQGSGVLTQLIAKEIDGKPVQSKIISALLLGTSLPVPKGKDVGGAFKSVPLCHAATQTGCVVTYASFRSNVPPPADSRFGKVSGENMTSACTNPAALGGGSAKLRSYFSSGSRNPSAPAPQWVKPAAKIETPFVSTPGLVSAQCVSNEHGSYLEVTVDADPKDVRIDDISGDVVTNGQVQANWGLHLIDVNLAMGNLVDIVSQQSKAYQKKAK